MADASNTPLTPQQVREKLSPDSLFASIPPMHDAAFLAKYKALAEKIGVSPVPVLLEYNTSGITPQASAAISREGHYYIILQGPQTKHDDLLALIGHELGHIKNGDLTPENLAEARNHPLSQRPREMAADQTAIDACLGRPLITGSLEFLYNLSLLAARNQGVTDIRQWMESQATDHPPLDQRIMQAVERIRYVEQSGQCPNPDAPTTVPNVKKAGPQLGE